MSAHCWDIPYLHLRRKNTATILGGYGVVEKSEHNLESAERLLFWEVCVWVCLCVCAYICFLVRKLSKNPYFLNNIQIVVTVGREAHTLSL